MERFTNFAQILLRNTCRYAQAIKISKVSCRKQHVSFFNSVPGTLVYSSLLALLASCGGGSNSGDEPDVIDTTPPTPVCPGPGAAYDNPVLYLATVTGVPPTNLLVTDADNPTAGSVVVNGPLTTQQSISDFKLSPDNNCVIYISDENTAGRFELFSVDLGSPGQSVRLNPPLQDGKDVSEFVLSPVGSDVLYIADQDVEGRRELYMVNVSMPGIASKINAPLTIDGDVSINDFQFSLDGTQILYVADQRVNGIFEIFLVEKQVPGVATMLNPAFTDSVNLAVGTKFSPDGHYVGYLSDQDLDETRELFVVDTTTAGVAIKLNPDYDDVTDVCTFRFRPDSAAVAYCADQDTNGVLELYEVTIDNAGVSTKINSPLVAGGEVRSSFRYGPQSDYLIYIADQNTAGVDELYRVEVASPALASKINSELVVNGDVDLFSIRSDGLAVAYVADQDTDSVFELYEVSPMDSGTAIKMNPPRIGNDLIPIAYNTSGSTIYYLADQQVQGRKQLYRVDTQTPTQTVRLNVGLVAGGTVSDFAIPQ